jgi:hypothetical protein
MFISSTLAFLIFQGCSQATEEIERPEKIVSKRKVVYDTETYAKLARLWERYNQEYLSEDAYANWMYAARYASDPNYEKLLERGIEKYPANPVLLYLYGLRKHGSHDDLEGQTLHEKATRLDPSYMDPWFALVIHYMDRDPERTDVALQHLLKGGAIHDEVLDYSYNMLACLDENSILITNGDMDTYPGWILMRLLSHRQDVTIANRSMLNTDWYPFLLMDEGTPRFVTQSSLDELREKILSEIKTKNITIPSYGPFSDTLIVRIIEAATRAERSVYFAATLFSSDVVDRYRERGHNLGLVTLVNPRTEPYPLQLKNLLKTWISDFRTGGLDSWRLRYAKEGEFSWTLVMNYATSLYRLIDSIVEYAPEYRLNLFRWYQKHLLDLIPQKDVDKINKMWCRSSDIKEIRDWCRSQGYVE